MKNNFERSVSMQCPTCGGESFEHDETNPEVRCVRCDRVMIKADLLEANGARVDAEVEQLKADVIKDAKADFRKIFKKWK